MDKKVEFEGKPDYVRRARLALTQSNPVAGIAVVACDLSEYLSHECSPEDKRGNALLLLQMTDYLNKKGGSVFAETAVRSGFAAALSLVGEENQKAWESTKTAYAALDDTKKIEFISENFCLFKGPKSFEALDANAQEIKKMWQAIPWSKDKTDKLSNYLNSIYTSEPGEAVNKDQAPQPNAAITHIPTQGNIGSRTKECIAQLAALANIANQGQGVGAARG